MRRRLLLTSVMSLTAAVSAPLASSSRALAQDPPPAAPAAEPAAEPAAPAPEAAPSAEPAPAPEAEPASAEKPELQPPQLAPLELPAPGPELPDPGEAARQLEAAAPPAPPEKKGWTASETAFHMRGYMRMRGTLLKDGWLGHSAKYDRLQLEDGSRSNYDPFTAFAPADRFDLTGEETANEPVLGGCGSKSGSGAGHCSKQTQVSGDLRLRLKPEIALSDDIRVKAWIDVLDNVGLGTMGYGPNNFSSGNAIRVRRVWGEARNRDIGELRFGRMGADWGLGILDNGGDRYGIDSDFSSDVDRIMGMTNLAGFYLMAAYDWASEGQVKPGSATPSGVPIDSAQSDDTDVFTFAVARRLEPEAQQGALLRGEKVFNYGAYFVYRDQLLKEKTLEDSKAVFARLNQTQYIPDLWLQFLWEGLRVEAEAAFVAGSLEGGCPLLDYNDVGNRDGVRDADERLAASADSTGNDGRAANGQCKFRQFGGALELEYRLFDDKLSLNFATGFASGDANGYGLAATNDPSLQRSNGGPGNRTISTFQFHPDYRIDLILWRTLMRRVAGAYYVKPGLGYDFIKDPYGQVAGGRFDVVYSRASSPKQAWGEDGNLGLELDVSLYYRSEDGPDILDGFYGLVQWGVLFPFAGLGYSDDIANGSTPNSKNAMIFRGVAGISF